MLLLKTDDRTASVQTAVKEEQQQLLKSKLFQSDVLPLTVGEAIADIMKPDQISKRYAARVICAIHGGGLLKFLNSF